MLSRKMRCALQCHSCLNKIKRGFSTIANERVDEHSTKRHWLCSKFHKIETTPTKCCAPITTMKSLAKTYGPARYHNRKLEEILHMLVHRMLLTALNEIKLGSVFAGTTKGFENVPKALKYELIKTLYLHTTEDFLSRHPLSTKEDLDRIDIDELVKSLNDETAASVKEQLGRYFQLNAMRYELLTLPYNSIEYGDRNWITNPVDAANTIKKLETAFVENNELPFTILNIVEILSRSNEFLHPQVLYSLLVFFQKNKLDNYSKIIFDICQQERIKVPETVFVELLLINDDDCFIQLIDLLLKNEKKLSKEHLSTSYIHSYGNANKQEEEEEEIYKLNSQDLVPPMKQSNYQLLEGFSRWKYPENLFYRRNKPGKARLLAENCLSDTGKVAMVRITDYTGGFFKFQTVDPKTFIVAMENCLKWKQYALIDLLTYKWMANSYFLSHDDSPELRIDVSDNAFNISKKYLAANNLSFEKIDGSLDIEILFPVDLVNVYLEKIKATQDNDQLQWLINLLQFIYLRPLMMGVTEKVSLLLISDRKQFDRKYNNFFNVDDIIKYEVYNLLGQARIGIDVIRELYSVCLELNAYTTIKDLEDSYKIDFDRIIDSELRNSTKQLIEDTVREMEFKKANEEWKKSSGLFRLSNIFR